MAWHRYGPFLFEPHPKHRLDNGIEKRLGLLEKTRKEQAPLATRPQEEGKEEAQATQAKEPTRGQVPKARGCAQRQK
jgi:hypothetical protein